MECITHFSHHHPLSFFQLGDFDDVKPYECAICTLPILHTPSYTCTADCTFFLHKPCAELPEEFYHDAHSDTLQLMPAESHQKFTYRCRNYSHCEFELHPLVAKPMEIRSKHISHESHPLVAFCRDIVCKCDACGDEHRGFFFYCQHQDCHFCIHQDCTVLPSVVKLRDNPNMFILAYTIPFNLVRSEGKCWICNKPWHLRHNGLYINEYFKFAHVNCAKSKMLESDHTVQEIVELPDEEDTFPSLSIRRSIKQEESRQEKHKHPLILEEYGRDMSCDHLVCDACTQPINDISSPFYRCQSDGCHFLVHKMCSDNLPTNVEVSYSAIPLKGVLSEYDYNFFNSVYSCIFCFLPSNGFVYHLFNKGSVSGFCDVECALAPKIIKHASHRQHLLFQMMFFRNDSVQHMSCCSRESLLFDIYKCVVCDFCIHIRCAQLPKRTRQKFDHHPLELITKADHKTEHGHLFCELCEEEIELKLWYYGCHICEQYFHINCIPSVGLLRKVKFGKTHVDRGLHEHPLTLTRMLTHGFHESCGVCQKIVKGFAEDEMAFHCSACNLWIHFSCANTAGLPDYSLFQKQFEQYLRDSARPKLAVYDRS